jgi:hypothetical protein
MHQFVKYLCISVLVVVLWIPLGDKLIGFIPEWKLNGSFDEVENPTWTLEQWKDGSFQSAAEAWYNQEMGGREYLIRLRNQYYFDVFDKAMANGVVKGTDGVLLDNGYIDAFYGKDFAGNEFLSDKLSRWKRVQQGLDSIGIKAFLALAPGKCSYFEENFPESVRDTHRLKTNYQFITEYSDTAGIRVLDLKKLFHLWSDTSRYPLFPKGGIHWSEYGAAKAIDTLRGYIQHINGRPLQKFWYEIMLSDTARGTDSDISDGMNLLFTPNEEQLAYPFRYFGEDSTLEKTHFLAIGDSYYYTILYSGFGDRVCNFGGFWYYFKKAEPDWMYPNQNVEELDILAELKKQDVLMLMMTEPQLKRFGWGTVEKLESLLYPEEEN